MFWDNILLERTASEADLAQASARLFEVPSAHVCVTSNIVLCSSASPLVEVTAECVPIAGDFVQQVSFYLSDANHSAAGRIQEAYQRANALISLCNALKTRCLLPDNTMSPTRFLLVDPEGSSPVTLDAEALDNEIYRIKTESSMPHTTKKVSAAA